MGVTFENFQSSLVIPWSTYQQGQRHPGAYSSWRPTETLLARLVHPAKPELAFHKISRQFVCPLKFEKLWSRASSKVMDPLKECANLPEGALRRAPVETNKQKNPGSWHWHFPPRSPVCETDNIHPLEAAVLIRQGAYSHGCRC